VPAEQLLQRHQRLRALLGHADEEVPYTTNKANLQEKLDEADEGWIKEAPRVWVYNQKVVAVLGKNMTEYASSDLPEVRFWAKG
jgi:hypothetical protein